MSNIIIEGKNLNDINQSNFQTVGVRSSFYFTPRTDLGSYHPTTWSSLGGTAETDDFIFNTVSGFADIYGVPVEDITVFDFLKLIQNTTIEPWQGRLHYDKEIEDSIALDDPNFDPNQYFNFFKEFGSNLQYPFFYLGDVYNNNLKYNINDKFSRIENNHLLGVDKKFNDNNEPKVYLVKDERFSLGTYTENNKQFWEIQTTDTRTRKSQFPRSKMKTAAASLVIGGDEDVVSSDEEFFSVDALVFTDREDKTTPLCFYYDKELHPSEYRLASNGKVFMQLELRNSGRDTLNNIDLYQERIPYRPFRLGFEKEEQDGGRGDVYGEGLYLVDQNVTLTGLPYPQSYMIGIYDSIGNLKSSNENYSLIMPNEDVAYQARFRPNPTVIVKTRYVDFDSGELIQDVGDESKGQIKAFPSYNSYDSNDEEYSVSALNGVPIPEFLPIGEDFVGNLFRPTLFGGSQYTIQVNEVTSNYTANSFTYVSSSTGTEVELPTSTQTGADADLNQNDARKQKSFELKEHFRYPLTDSGNEETPGETRTILIYVTYKSAAYVIQNFNNSIDFENGSLEEALTYGPMKYAILRSRTDYNFLDRYSDEVRFQLYDNAETITNPTPPPALILSDPELSELPTNYDGYDVLSGSFEVYQKNFIGNDALVSEIKPNDTALPPTTLSHAISVNNNIAPIFTQGPTTDPPEFEVGDTTSVGVTGIGGSGGIFKLLQINTEEIDNEEDETIEFIYQYIWGVNMDYIQNNAPYYSTVRPFRTIYHLDTYFIDQGIRGVELTPNLQSNNLLASSGESTPILNTETTSSIRYVPIQEGTYVKPVLQGGIDTIFELTNVGPDEIVRAQADSGVINANMFNFGEEVRFQITPSEPAEQPLFNVFVWDNEDLTLKNINDGDINLTKEQLGVTFDWNEGGNFGTLDYTVPESRDAAIFDGNRPIWFKYIEFRFSIFEIEDFEGDESGDGVSSGFHVTLSAFDIPGSGGEIQLPGGITFTEPVDLFPDDVAWEDMTPFEKRITITAVPTQGEPEGEWSFLTDPDTTEPNLTDSISDGEHVAIITFIEPGSYTINYNWFGGEGDDYGGP